MIGDHVLVEDESGNRTPYYWNGTEWVMADSTTPSSLTFKILQNVLYDATHSPGTIESQSIVNLFAQNFAAYNAFIQKLFTQSIELQNDEEAIGDIHSQGYFRGAYLDPDVKSGFFLGADGYIELFKAILRDVTIISEDDDGSVIFSISTIDSGLSFSHTENAVVKSFEDLLPSVSPTFFPHYVTVAGYSCQLYIGELTSYGTPGITFINQRAFTVFDEDIASSGSSIEFTAPYSCTIEVMRSSGSLSVLINDSQILAVSSSWSSFSALSGDVIKLQASSSVSGIRARVISFTDSCGGKGAVSFSGSTNTDLIFICRQIDGRY